MRYGSVCSGVEAATMAWHPLGWEAQWFSEIEPFPSAVLQHHYPEVPNLGDMTLIHSNPIFNETTIDVLVGGTPCQSFSVAGLRKGMEDPRGNLALEFCRIADKAKPQWIVWENVPGVLSSNGGKDFGSLLGALGELGYGFAYRILDAQNFGVPQRRRRVFVVGYLGDWRPAAGIFKDAVETYWKDKPVRFAYKNNCVGCFHRNEIFLNHMSKRDEKQFDWFMRMEQENNCTFKNGITYEKIKNYKMQLDLFDEDFNDCDSGYCGL